MHGTKINQNRHNNSNNPLNNQNSNNSLLFPINENNNNNNKNQGNNTSNNGNLGGEREGFLEKYGEELKKTGRAVVEVIIGVGLTVSVYKLVKKKNNSILVNIFNFFKKNKVSLKEDDVSESEMG